jgi:uncharacterized protein YllA (UPF0747 family)
MKSQCLPFTQIPHTTRLFLDYLSYTPAVRGMYPRSPIFSEWVKEEAQRVVYDGARRSKVSEILERQNRAWGASGKALANIERLRRGAVAAVTGQQVGLFGGPLFSIFKALTAVKLAEQATAAGVDCVPVFWLATEDHDLAEVSQVALLSEQGLCNLSPWKAVRSKAKLPPMRRWARSSSAQRSIPRSSGRLRCWEIPRLPTGCGRRIARVRLLGARLRCCLRGCLRSGESFCSIRRIKSFMSLRNPCSARRLKRASELDEGLLARGKAIEAAGYHQQVKVTSETTTAF